MPIEPGRLRHQVRFEEYAYVGQNPQTGDEIRAWQQVGQPSWAAIEPLSAREFIQSATTQVRISTRLVIRYRGDLREDMRAVHLRRGQPGVIYNIHGLLPDKDDGLEYLTIPVSTGVGPGQ